MNTNSELRQILIEALPEELHEAVRAIGLRVRPSELDDLVEQVCRQQAMGRSELAVMLGRSEKHMQDCLRRMLNAGRIELLHPDIPNHPDQKYTCRKAQPETPD